MAKSGAAAVTGLVLTSLGVGLALVGCSGSIHDCHETHTCPAPVGFIDAGSLDDWWSAGAADGSSAPGEPVAVEVDAGRSTSDATGGAGGASVTSDEAPSVLEVSPPDGAIGVTSDAEIVITFSGPIDARSFEAAYQSADLPAAELTFTWNASQTVLTMQPKTALSYQAGSALPEGGVGFSPKTYRYGFHAFTSDDQGHVLEGKSFAFSTLREASTELRADASRTGNWTDGEGEGIHNCLRAATAPYAPTVCVGDDSNNVRYTGFVSFDLSGLPGGISRFSSARLRASATVYGSTAALGASLLEQLAFGELGEAALDVQPNASLGAFYGGADLASNTHFELSEDVTSAVETDYAKRGAGSNLNQYRLGFAQVIADGAWDDIELSTSSIRLSTTYLLP